MSGYTASARIVRVPTRIADHRGEGMAHERRMPDAPGPVVIERTAGRDARPAGVSAWIAERRSRISERWHQLTFYLTDPQSWR